MRGYGGGLGLGVVGFSGQGLQLAGIQVIRLMLAFKMSRCVGL